MIVRAAGTSFQIQPTTLPPSGLVPLSPATGGGGTFNPIPQAGVPIQPGGNSFNVFTGGFAPLSFALNPIPTSALPIVPIFAQDTEPTPAQIFAAVSLRL